MDSGTVRPKTGTLRACSPIFIIGIIFSVALTLLRPLTYDDSFGKMANVAASIASGHGFASPIGGFTGATAVVPPLYVWLLSLIIHVFGIRTGSSLLAAQMLDGLFFSATAYVMYALAMKAFGARVATWSGWLWLFAGASTFLLPGRRCFPYSAIWCFDLWETALSTLLLTSLLLVTLYSESWDGLLKWCGFGILFGLAALSNPATLAVLPACIVWWTCICGTGHHRSRLKMNLTLL